MTSHDFQHEDNLHVTHKHKQQWREERDACFLSWKYSQYFEFVSANDENIKVHCTLRWQQSTIKLQKHKFEETFGVAEQHS